MRRATPNTIYRLKVSLTEIDPPVWRRLLVPSEITLARLHRILQAAMGWTNSHLHCFEAGGRRFGMVGVEEDADDLLDERRAKLSSVLTRKGTSVLYSYDYGDGWDHTVLLEEIEQPDRRFSYPLCIGGARACPPEDCGGVDGYEELVRVLNAPGHEEHDSMVTWLGGHFDPDSFDLNAVNRALRSMR